MFDLEFVCVISCELVVSVPALIAGTTNSHEITLTKPEHKTEYLISSSSFRCTPTTSVAFSLVSQAEFAAGRDCTQARVVEN
jgi:hypothetical protein